MDRLNTIINDLIVSNEFDLIQPVIKAGLLSLVRDQHLTEFLTSIEHISHQQKSNFHLPFLHFNQQLLDIEHYLQTLAQTLETQYQYKFFPYQTYLSQLPYNAVRQQLLHTTHIIRADFYLKFIEIFEYYLGAYAAQQARIACAELIKGFLSICSDCRSRRSFSGLQTRHLVHSVNYPLLRHAIVKNYKNNFKSFSSFCKSIISFALRGFSPPFR